ncbi:MAG: NOL1/NOP2/sun family putative RNA methylase [Clostridia bacterium]|nr:NOL1/NOP2/sun family putative RNA methylase [Clostridia bacterium]
MIDEKFYERMKNILGDDFESFKASLDAPPVRAIRVNTTKISTADFLSLFNGELTPLGYAEDGFILESSDGIGLTPEHHSGMIYVQDPGAMATVNALDIKEGTWVLDACSAPGGKTSQLASRVGDGGFVLANEYVPKRAKIIVSNLERLGVRNAMVTSLDTARLTEMFDSVFDIVLCDAPCSGEGMIRKYDEASVEWSEENVMLCAERQREILGNVIPTLKPGGHLIYSTCTYSKEENEQVALWITESFPELQIVPVKDTVASVTADGIAEEKDAELRLTRRFYPHVSRGEGQYIAVFKKRENDAYMPTILYKDAAKPVSKEETRVTESFMKEHFPTVKLGRLIKQGDYVVSVTHGCPVPAHSVFMPGVTLGEVKKGVFFPHQQLISAYGAEMKNKENLTRGDERVAKYLRGEEIDAKETRDGWCAVCYEGVALGGGKVSGGKIKNHYPKGLRNKN